MPLPFAQPLILKWPLRAGQVVPDIDIGVRGQAFEFDGSDCVIESPAYIIDGWQRVGNALQLLESIPDLEIRIGALVHFGTSRAWEKARFTELNNNTKRVASDLHMRNLCEDKPAVLTLYGVTHNEPGCALYNRVSWKQNKTRGDLIGAFRLARVLLKLHSHMVAWSTASRVDDVALCLEAAADAVTLQRFRRNCLVFIHLIDECFGIRSIEYARSAPQIRLTFLLALAKVLTDHSNFWEDAGRALAVDSNWRRKFAQFPIHDPNVDRLAGAGGMARDMLYDLLVKHLDSGRRTNKLDRRT